MTGETCVANIGPGERRQRLRAGIVGWAIAAAGLVALLIFDVTRLARLALALPLWLGAIGFFQHREKT